MTARIRRTVVLTMITVGLLAAAAYAQAAPAGEGQTIDMFRWFVIRGGPIGWFLILVDFASWAVIIEHFVSIRRLNVLPPSVRAQVAELVEARQYREVIELTGVQPDYFSYVVHQGLTEASHGYAAMERAMEEASEERTTKLLRKIELLNIIGNVAPMLGLLGTVLGMILAFSDIVAIGGVPAAGQLAGSIGVALVTTFWGLVVAIPALAVYAMMRNRIDALTSEGLLAAEEMLSVFRPAPRRAASAGRETTPSSDA